MQTVVQGRFKKRLKMSDVYFGSTFPQPLAYAPPQKMSKIIDAVLRRVGKSAFVLFYHVILSVQYEVSLIWPLRLALHCLYLFAFATHMY